MVKSVESFLLLASLALCLCACADLGTTDPGQGNQFMRPLTTTEKVIVNADNSFGLKLFARLNGMPEARGQNLFISPLSVSMALGMTLNGARGTTKDAMQRTLEFNGLTQEEINTTYLGLISTLTQLDEKVKMQIANSIWYRPTLLVEEGFKDVNRQYFSAEVNSIDFSLPTASGVINSWVDRNTNGKIKSIVPDPIPDGMVMYLINAVYFKGSWTYRFEPSATKDDTFRKSDGSTVPCRMMTYTETLPYVFQDGVQVVDLPYGGMGFSMTVVLPPAATNIDAFIAGMSQAKWEGWLGGLDTCKVALYMPKFKLEYKNELNNALAAMGMEVAFTGSADFTGIDKRGSLAISEVRHKTFVQVDEEGTEAAGVTSIGMETTAAFPPQRGPAVVRLDHPFVYVIRERSSGAILFVGKMEVPGWQD